MLIMENHRIVFLNFCGNPAGIRVNLCFTHLTVGVQHTRAYSQDVL